MRTALKLGPGVFEIGLDALAVEQQLTNLRIGWSENVSAGDDTNFLDGSTELGDEDATYRATVSGNVQQDALGAAEFIAFTWAHKGQEVPFTFRPRNDIARQVTGVCVPVPVEIGGDVKTKNRSDFTFRCIGDPELGDTVL